MELKIITNEDEFRNLSKEWDELCDKVKPFVFQYHYWLWTWWQTEGKQDGEQLYIVTGRIDGKLILILPLVKHSFGGIKILKWLAEEPSDYCDVIIEENIKQEQCIKEAWQLIKKHSKTDVIQFTRLREDSVFYKVLGPELASIYDNVAPYVLCETNWESYYKSKIKGDLRRDQGRKRRRLAEHGKVEFEVYENQEDLIKYVLEKKYSQYTGKGVPKNMRSNFYQEIANLAHQHGHLHLSSLKVGDKILAVHFGLCDSDRMYWYIPVFEEDWYKYSPGRILLEELIKLSFAQKLKYFDFLFGDERYKSDWSHGEMKIYKCIIPKSLKGYGYMWWKNSLRPKLRKLYLTAPSFVKKLTIGVLKK